MNRKEQKNRHLKNLSDILGSSFDSSRYNNLKLLEKRYSKFSVDYCNGDLSYEQFESKVEPIRKAVIRIFKGSIIENHIYFNNDPRGYALKINDDFVRNNNIRIERDFGGYGILAPEFK